MFQNTGILRTVFCPCPWPLLFVCFERWSIFLWSAKLHSDYLSTKINWLISLSSLVAKINFQKTLTKVIGKWREVNNEKQWKSWMNVKRKTLKRSKKRKRWTKEKKAMKWSKKMEVKREVKLKGNKNEGK